VPLTAHDSDLHVAGPHTAVRIHGDGADIAASSDGGELCWAVTVHARSELAVDWFVETDDQRSVIREPAQPASFHRPVIEAPGVGLAAIVGRAVDDLTMLRAATGDRPE